MSISRNPSIRITSILSFIFFFSGFAALIYQVAWQRILTVHYGVGAISTTLIVSVYMFGLGLGSLFGGFFAERIKKKISLYFMIELLIGCFGIISLPFLDFLGRYTAGSSYLLSFCYMFLFLSVPTFLMGMTLPLLTKIFNAMIHDFLKTVSLLYFINTLGAAIGSVFASYIIISFFGLDSAVYAAAAINFVLALLILLSRNYVSAEEEIKPVSEQVVRSDVFLGKIAYLFVLITGFLAIGYEIVWFRVVGALVKSSPYSFSSVLSVYLLGIAVGSFGMNKYLKKRGNTDKRNLFFLIQFLIGLSVVVIFTAYYYLTKDTYLATFTRTSFAEFIHPIFQMRPLHSIKIFLWDIYLNIDIFLWPMLFVSIPTMLMGASFPLISLLALTQANKEGMTIGTVYFYNIAGNVLGGIITGFLLLPYFGTERTLLGFASIGILFLLFISRLKNIQLLFSKRIALALALLVITFIFFPAKGQLYEVIHKAGGIKQLHEGFDYTTYFEEGRDGFISTYRINYPNEELIINYINGLPHGGYPLYGFHFRTIEAASLASDVKDVLIIGFGTGAVTEAVLKMQGVEKLTIAEINRDLITNLTKMELFKRMLSDHRVNLILDDGRRVLLRSNEKYDLILIDPLRATTAYSNNIYSKEFFELASQHLKMGGVFSVFKTEHRVLPKTILSIFKYVLTYGKFCAASNMPIKRNNERWQSFFQNYSLKEQSKILRYANTFGLPPEDINDVKREVAPYPVNHDWKPVAEYYIGLRTKKWFYNLR